MKTQQKISLFQFILLISGIQLSMVPIPKQLTVSAGTDGWISLIIGYFIAIITGLCAVQIYMKNPTYTLYDFFINYFGKWLGKTGVILWTMYFLYAVILFLFNALFITHIWILPNMSAFWIMILFLIPTYMVVKSGVQVIGQYAVVVLPLGIISLILLAIPLKNGELIYMLPVLKDGWLPIINSIKIAIKAFIGIEITLILLPFLDVKQSAKKGIIIANTFTLIVYIYLFVACSVYFSPDEITKFLWPVLMLVKPIHFVFLERFEIIYLALFFMSYQMTIFMYCFAFKLNISQLFQKKSWMLPLNVLFIFLIVSSIIFVPSSEQIKEMWEIFFRTGYIAVYAFPILFLIYVSVFTFLKRRERL
ncbi:endospore germination permease [Lysinibacillus capsici]|uniref:GerAB/ArcD/ProY family transporter n=1 Tax=Lysinibacillus capsici TaxID=2115968 RepID=UPI0029DE77E5|nr:endospore germination permease [Lysinibacillus capsici]WPK07501.1 endospore germination permease [Lysinibacillus capsici]